jgi:hypothetical protein
LIAAPSLSHLLIENGAALSELYTKPLPVFDVTRHRWRDPADLYLSKQIYMGEVIFENSEFVLAVVSGVRFVSSRPPDVNGPPGPMDMRQQQSFAVNLASTDISTSALPARLFAVRRCSDKRGRNYVVKMTSFPTLGVPPPPLDNRLPIALVL